MENMMDMTRINPDKRKNATVEVQVSEDKKIAYIRLIPPLNGGMPPVYNDLVKAVEDAKVVYGVRQDILEKLAITLQYNKSIKIAEAMLPVPGENSKIEYKFTATKDRKPKELPDGSVDFKSLGILQNVRKDEILCEKIPATEGIKGIDVQGNPIEAKKGSDVPLMKGVNTYISKDGLTMHAAMDGYVDSVSNKISVTDVFHIQGDVGIKTGNIDFVGTVHISGNVLQGYEVKADGNVIIDGYVEGGSVRAGGNIFIDRGILGMNISKIVSGGDLRCKYIQNAQADVEVNFETEYAIGSIINSGGNARFIGNSSVILGSHVTVRHTINCVNVGSQGSTAFSTLEVGSDPYIVERMASLPSEIKEVQKQINGMEQLLALFQQKDQRGILSEDAKREYTKIKISVDVLRKKFVKQYEEKRDIEQRMMMSGYGTINAVGTLYEGTLIIMGAEKKKLTSTYKYTMFSRTADGIVTNTAQ